MPLYCAFANLYDINCRIKPIKHTKSDTPAYGVYNSQKAEGQTRGFEAKLPKFWFIYKVAFGKIACFKKVWKVVE